MSKRARVSWKLAWTAFASMTAGALALLSHLTGLPVWMVALGTAGLAAGYTWAAKVVVDVSPMFARLTDRSRRQILTRIGAAAAVYAGWVDATAALPQWWPLWGLSLPVLGAGTYGMARMYEYLLKHRKPQPVRQPVAALAAAAHVQAMTAQAADLAAPRDGEPELVWHLRRALVTAGLPWLRVTSWEHLGVEGDRFGVAVNVWSPMVLQRSTGARVVREAAPTLGRAHARQIALALRDITRRPVAPNWVTITELDGRVGEYTVRVHTEDVMRRIRPYYETPEDLGWDPVRGQVDPEAGWDPARLAWLRFEDPKLFGYGEDGRPRYIKPKAHGRFLGGTQNGKSSAIHRMAADITRCHDAVWWVCGTEKLYDLVGPWLEPYLGTDFEPPIQWVRANQLGVVQTLIGALAAARYRQSLPFAARRGLPYVWVVLDEASFALENTSVRLTWQGQSVTAADMAAYATQACASGGVYVLFATQRGVNRQLGGARGGDVVTNLGYQAVFQSKDWAEVGRSLGDFKLPKLKIPGESWLDWAGPAPDRTKGEYIQTDDPSKPVLHDGPRLSEVAWNRRHFRRELDAGTDEAVVRAVGEAYSQRPRLVTEEYLHYIRTGGADIPAPPGATSAPVAPAAAGDGGRLAAMRAAFAHVLDKLDPGADAAGESVTPMSAYRTRADRVAAIVDRLHADTGQPVTNAQILDELRDQGDAKASPQLVMNALRALLDQTRVTKARDDDGQEVAGQYLPATVTVRR